MLEREASRGVMRGRPDRCPGRGEESDEAKSGASRVLEFVLERAAFYSPFATATISYQKTCFPLVKRVRFEMKSDVLKSVISQS